MAAQQLATEVLRSRPSVFVDTDIANGKRLVKRHGACIRYTVEQGFFLWDGRRWTVDQKQIALAALAKDTALAIVDELNNAASGVREMLYRNARSCQSKAKLEAMMWSARSEPGTLVQLSDFDIDPWQFNTSTGTIDLRTGKLQAHVCESLISKMTNVSFDPKAECPQWIAFLNRVTNDNRELYDYLRRFVGYLLVGDTREQVLHFLYGDGANGKTVFCEVVQALLGDYAVTANTDLVMLRRHTSIPNDVARLRGVRVAFMNETAQGARFDEAKLKDLTGGDTLSARFLHHEYFDFRPTHRLVIRGNHKPTISGTDDGIWRRLRLLPFTVQIPLADQDHGLRQKLETELPGILNWALVGCAEWQRSGLCPPSTIIDAAREYREESDTLGRFIAECCESRTLGQVKSSVFFTRYQQYSEQASERWLPCKDLPREIQRRGYQWKRTKTGSFFVGLELKAADLEHF